MCDYCKGCPYEGHTKVESVRMDKETLIVMLCPGESEEKLKQPLASEDPTSATMRIKNNLPTGRTLEDYAVTELVRCCPGRDKNNKYLQPEVSAIALCYRFLEDELCKGSFKRVVTLSAVANSLVENIRDRFNLSFEHKKGRHPQNGVANEEIKQYFEE